MTETPGWAAGASASGKPQNSCQDIRASPPCLTLAEFARAGPCRPGSPVCGRLSGGHGGGPEPRGGHTGPWSPGQGA